VSQRHARDLGEAFWDFPLELAFHLAPEAWRRLGYEVTAGSAVTQASLKARSRMKRYLLANYRVAGAKTDKPENLP
jgi:hypothetical protein